MNSIVLHLYMMVFYSLIIFPVPILLLGYSFLSLLSRGLSPHPVKALGRSLPWLLLPYGCAVGIMGINAIALSHIPEGSRSPASILQPSINQSIGLVGIQLALIGLGV
jgi:hypothetical protein